MKTPHTIDDTQTLELLKERAEVQKQRVNTGKVILSKRYTHAPLIFPSP